MRALCCIPMLSEEVKNKIENWAQSECLVKKAYVFGSRARTDFKEESDLDIAVEIIKSSGDENLLATWIFEADGMKSRLAAVIPEYNVDLQWFDGDNTQVIKDGIRKSSYVVYEA